MSTATAARAEVGASLVPSKQRRNWEGFGNLFRKEMGQWWTTKLWWIQTLIWLGLINGIGMIVSLVDDGMTPSEHFLEATQTPFLMSVVVVTIGVVVTVQGAISLEKEAGTAAWVMSKPVSRASFVLSKIAAHSFGFLVTGVLIPSVVFAITSRLVFPGMLDYGAYVVGWAVVALSVVFYVALTVCLGTFFDGNGPVAGLGIAVILTGQFFSGMLPEWLVTRTPWPLGNVAVSYVLNTPPEWNRLTPIAITAVASVVLGVVAVWRFRRDEF